ncbi:hypothetical protein [Streptomyces sp. NPDC001270]|uniref:hypothetical protein n=1 Tax=Streptomyces sp. NPDC001270 TaxID=3364554 RepID=UPI0036D16CF2
MSESTPSAPAAPATPSTPAAPAAPVALAAPATPAPPAPVAPPNPTPAPTDEPQNVASLPEWAQQLIGNTRAEAAQWRTRAQGTTVPAEPAPQSAAEGDVSRLPRWAQQAVTDGQGAARTLAVQTAVIATAPAAGADIARLLDSSSAMRALAAVDPADQAAVTAAIQAAVTAQPHLAAGGFNPGRGGVEFSTPTSADITPQQFAAMDYAARAELYQTAPDTYRRLAG